MPRPIHSGPDTTWDDFPSPEQIDKWEKGEADEVPAVNKEPEVEETQKEAEPQPQDEVEETQPTEKEEKADVKSKPKEKSKYEQAKEARKADEHRRNEEWKQLRQAKAELEQQKREIEDQKKGLQHTPEQWEQLAQHLESQGLFNEAQAARNQAQQVKQELTRRNQEQLSQQQIADQWRRAEQDIARQDPAFFQEGSYVNEGIKKILADDNQRDLYHSHPLGIWALYHRVVAEHAQQLIPPIVKYAKDLEARLAKYEKSNSPITSVPKGAPEGRKRFEDMKDDEQQAVLEKQFADLAA